MQLKYKLALLELIGGIFGWVWILALLAALYFLVMALFAGGVGGDSSLPWGSGL